MSRRLLVAVGAALVTLALAVFLLWPDAGPVGKGGGSRSSARTQAGAGRGGDDAQVGVDGAGAAGGAERQDEAGGGVVTVEGDGVRPARAGTPAAELGVPALDTAAELELEDLCGSLAKDRRNLQTSLNMVELLPEQNQNTVGARRLRFVTDRLDRTVQRKAALARKRGLDCPEE